MMNNNAQNKGLSKPVFRPVMMAVMILLSFAMWAQSETGYAGITVAEAIEVNDTVQLLVRDGGNYMKVESEHLPATFVYVPDTAFGPLPVATLMGDTMNASVVFSGCRMGWVWEVQRPEDESAQLVTILAHENATVYVYPLVCPDDEETTVEAWDSLAWKDAVYTESGDYVDTITTVEGCRYFQTLHLTIHKTLYSRTEQSACDSLVRGDTVYTESGEYILDTVALTSGDRQVNILVLTISHSTTAEIEQTVFDSYVSPLGNAYTESGVYTEKTVNTVGCDSTITLRLTIHKTLYDTIHETVCDRYAYGLKTYTTSGTYNDTTVLPNGDRKVTTLELTIHYANSEEQYISRCESYTSPLGNTYTESGVYMENTVNAAGCDSTITLHVTIAHASYGQMIANACMSFVAPSGKVYTESGVYADTTVNAAGCDSIITLHLTIEPDCFEYDTVYFCRGLNTAHDEQISEGLMRRYRPYVYESPAAWDYMEGVIAALETDRALVDMYHAESNLYSHYVGELEPVEVVMWSYCPKGETTYQALTASEQPQWIGAGVVAMQVQFLCGHSFRSDFRTDTEETELVETDSEPLKVIRDGQVLILRGNAVYTPLGQKIQ